MELSKLVAARIQFWDAEQETWVEEENENCTDIMLPKAVWAAVLATMVESGERNENLLRIIRERANADRNLRPKKEHTGYVLLSFTEKKVRATPSLMITQAYETVIQSPYPVATTPLEVAKKEICRSLFKDGICAKIGIAGRTSDIETDQGAEIPSWEAGKSNVAFGIKYRANCRDGYWEITLQHSKPLTAFPADMLPGK